MAKVKCQSGFGVAASVVAVSALLVPSASFEPDWIILPSVSVEDAAGWVTLAESLPVLSCDIIARRSVKIQTNSLITK